MTTRIEWATQAVYAARVFGLPFHVYQCIAESPDPDAAVRAWKRLDKDLQAAWKRSAARAHPDSGGSHEEFIKLREAWEFIQDQRFAVALWLSAHPECAQPPRAAPSVQRYQVFTGMDIHSTTSATTTSTSTGSIFADGVTIFVVRR